MPHAYSAPITIAVGGIGHESHALSGMVTTLADFEQRAVEVDAGGLATEDLSAFAYHHVRRPIVPLDPSDRVSQARARMVKVQPHV